MNTQEIFKVYFENKAAYSDLTKAYFAYHTNDANYRQVDGAHNFYNDNRECSCAWCGKKRWQVRWNEEAPECLNRPYNFLDIASTLYFEEEKYFLLLDKAKKKIPKIIRKKFGKVALSSEILAYLQTTHGYDPDCVAEALEIESIEHLMPEFENVMNIHIAKSGNFKG